MPTISTPGTPVTTPMNFVGLARPPRVTDNSSNGYGSTSIWAANGELYAPTVAPDTNSALWQKIENVGGSCFTDVATAANTIFAGGLVSMKSGFTGPAIDISVTIATTPTTFTINILTSGEIDVVALQAAMGQADASTAVTCIKLYDQSGAGNHYVKNASYPAPYVAYDALLGRYCLQFDGKTATPRVLQAPAGVITTGTLSSGFGVTGNSFTTAVYGRGTCCSVNAGALGSWALGDMLNPTTGDRRFLAPLAQTSGEYQFWRNGSAVATTPKVAVDLNPCYTLTSSSTTLATVSVNEEIGTLSISSDTAVYTSGYIGSWSPATSSRSSHRVVSFAVAKVALTAAQQTILRNGHYARFDIRPQVLDQVYLIGDSRTASALPLAQRYESVATLLADRVARAARVYGFGNDSHTSALMGSTTIPFAVARYKTGVRNTAIMLAGVNDFIVSALTPAQSLAAIQANCLTLKNAGFRVILINELACTTATNSANTNLPILRGLIAAAGTSGMNCDYILDLNQYAGFATPATAAYYSDGLHPTVALDEVWASALVPLLNLA